MTDVSSIPDADLLKRAVTNARTKKRRAAPRWHAVSEVFALGSTYSAQLCVRFDLDPHEMVKP